MSGSVIGLGLLFAHALLFGAVGYTFHRIRKAEAETLAAEMLARESAEA